MLRPLRCAILFILPEYGFALPGMVELFGRWTLYRQSNPTKGTLQPLHTLERRTSSPQTKRRWSRPQIAPRPFLNNALGRIIHLQTYGKEGWNIFELMELQEVLGDSQLLMVEVQASDQSCHFVFVGPPRPNTLFILKEGSHFHGIKDPITFFGKYCDFHCRD